VVRTSLLLAGAGWFIAGLAALAVSVVGTDMLLALLPPLAVDADAVAGAAAAIGATLVAVAMIHAVVVVGLVRRVRWAWSAGILLAAVMSLGLAGTAIAAGVSVVAETLATGPGLLGGVGAAMVAIGYGWAGARLTRELASGTLT
jgi:hypothetical protein